MDTANGETALISSDPLRGSSKGWWRKWLVLYFLYAAAVLTVGAGFGLFDGPKKFSVNHTPNAQSLHGSMTAKAQPAPIPSGVLAFDQELKRASVSEGEREARFVFKVRNASRKPVTIEKVATSCGCTVAKLPQVPWILKPGDKGEFQVAMNLMYRTGTTTKDFTIFTSRGYKTLQIETTIVPATKTNSEGAGGK